MDYSKLADIYEDLISTTKTLEKTDILTKFLRKVPANDLPDVMLLLQGRAFPDWDPREIGVASKLAIKAISKSSGLSNNEIIKLWKDIGDLGKVAEHCSKKKKQATLFSGKLTSKKVLANLQKLSELEGPGTIGKKVSFIAELLSSASPVEAKYLVRTLQGELRIGVAEGIIRDAITGAYNVDKKLVQKAYDLSTDFGQTAKVAKEKGNKGLEKIEIKVGRPIRVMLFQKVENIKDAFKTVGTPAAIEYKYDGFRLELHRKGNDLRLFTRRLEDVTKQFPDVVDVVKRNVKSKDFILDSEVIGVDTKTGKWLPFQNISMRIKRKYNISETVKKIPVIVNVFDIMYLDGENFIPKPFKERRKAIEKLVRHEKDKIGYAMEIITDSEKEAEKFYKQALAKGNEGIMVKNLEAKYKPGSRVGYGVKVKPLMETLDLVIVGAEWGTGKRAKWLSSFVLACRNLKTGEYLEIGKMGTGVKEKAEEGTSFGELTKLLADLVLKEKDKRIWVKPKIVLEVGYEEIQKSPTYESGYALRFPRLIRLRDDRRPDEVDTLERVKKLYNAQRGRK